MRYLIPILNNEMKHCYDKISVYILTQYINASRIYREIV